MVLLAKTEMNQAQFAEFSGISKSTISNYVSGKAGRPAIFARFAKALNVDVTEIIED